MIWTILGISVALVAGFSVALVELLVGRPFFEQHRVHMAIILAAVGAGTLVLGSYLAGKQPEGESPEADKGFRLLDLRYWGPMLILLAGITFFIQTIADRMELIVSQRMKTASVLAPQKVAALEPSKAEPSKAESPKPRVPVVFPELKVQGLIFRADRPVVLINGRQYGVGDLISNAMVKEITRAALTIEKSNEVKVIALDGAPGPAAQVTNAGK